MLTDPNHTTIHLHSFSKRRAWLVNFDIFNSVSSTYGNYNFKSCVHMVNTHLSVTGFSPYSCRLLKTSARKARKSDRKSLITGRNPPLRIFANGTISGRIGVIKPDQTARVCHQSDVDLSAGVMCIGSVVMGRGDIYNRPKRSDSPPIRCWCKTWRDVY